MQATTREPGDLPWIGTGRAGDVKRAGCSVLRRLRQGLPAKRRAVRLSPKTGEGQDMTFTQKSGAVALATLAATPAVAHHPLAGAPMETFTHGILSGIGHPVLGFDHLFFVAIVGVAAMLAGQALRAPLAYIAAMLLGTLMMSFGIGMPVKEVVIALSLLMLGGAVLMGMRLSAPVVMALFAVFGLFHGSAYGDSIAGQEAAIGAGVLIGYLIGLGAVQYAIAIAAGAAMRGIWKATDASAVSARLAGAVVAGMGLFLTLEAAEGALFGLLGIA